VRPPKRGASPAERALRKVRLKSLCGTAGERTETCPVARGVNRALSGKERISAAMSEERWYRGNIRPYKKGGFLFWKNDGGFSYYVR